MGEIKRLQYFAGGQWHTSKSETYMTVYNPSTGQPIAETPCCTEEESTMPSPARKKRFRAGGTPRPSKGPKSSKLRDLLMEHLDELTYLVAWENGKAWGDAKGDVLKAKKPTEVACGIPSLMMGESSMDTSKGVDTVLYREPLGVFAGIVPL